MLTDGDMYPEDPSDRDYEGYQGNYGPTLTLTYRQAFIVMWFKSKALELKLDNDFDGALDSFNRLKSDEDNTKALQYINAIVDKVVAEPELVLGGYRSSRMETLLKAMTSIQTSSEVMCTLFDKILDLLLNSVSHKRLIDVKTAEALAHALEPFWHSENIIRKVIRLLAQNLKSSPSLCVVAFLHGIYSSDKVTIANEMVNGVCESILENPEKNTQK